MVSPGRHFDSLYAPNRGKKWTLAGKGPQLSHLFRSASSTRFHPNRRASTDHPPGPSSAKAAPTVDNKIQLNRSAARRKALKNAKIARRVPVTGVHKPRNKSIPTTPVSASSIADPSGGSPRSAMAAWMTKVVPATVRSKRRPAPGAPWAKVEKSRRTT